MSDGVQALMWILDIEDAAYNIVAATSGLLSRYFVSYTPCWAPALGDRGGVLLGQQVGDLAKLHQACSRIPRKDSAGCSAGCSAGECTAGWGSVQGRPG